ncbi:alpha/beta fold hydrolase [Kordiimonas pumila]|uniref:Alpha/beta fold hydrolase n=1 Tax=Kordiimonas pumila TaxID=2161677 RepID=A0ABV7D9G0_9PROT|nr:alpha/beta hydrolase [Kordiimonas pumila]
MSTGNGIAVNGTVLWVEDTGEANLPPIVCLHSLWLDGSMFDALVVAAKGRFRVVRPDFRGQGGSAPGFTDAISMDCCADDMIALSDALDLPPVHLLAASMGGDVAARMVAKKPDLFRSMVMVGSSVCTEPPEQKAHFTEWLDGMSGHKSFVGDDLDMLMSIMFGATTRARPDADTILDHWRKKLELTPRSAWPALIGVLERGTAVPLLAGITTPTFIMNGEEDMPRPPAWAKEVADGIKGAKLEMIKGVGHTPIIEAPEVVIPKILDFMAAH